MLSDFTKIPGPALVAAVVAMVVSGVMFAVWVGSRKRIAADTIGRAEEQAQRLVREAQRDAETTKKEALLEAKEKAHDIVVEAERQARADRRLAAAGGADRPERRRRAVPLPRRHARPQRRAGRARRRARAPARSCSYLVAVLEP